jgi:hypothetical protein
MTSEEVSGNVEIVKHSLLVGPKNICTGKRCVKKYLRIVCKRKLVNSDKKKCKQTELGITI